jgi:regulator of sigma E protease
MELISGFLAGVFSNTVPFVVLLGALIFVHELGHFLVAKYFGVRVEVFSLGFGKKVFQVKRGDTVYCLSIIPLGGYVKMYGDDPRADVPESEKAVSFLHKPLWPRTAVVLAGPMMNFFFAIFIFGVVSILGDHNVEPLVGDIGETSVAYTSGFRPGDRILDVNGHKIKSWKQFTDFIEDRAGQSLTVKVQDPTGNMRSIIVSPELKESTELLSSKSHVGTVPGLTNISRSTGVGITTADSVAATAGLHTHDIVTKVNGVSVLTWRDLVAETEKNKASGKLNFEVDRYGEGENKETLKFEVPVTARAARSNDVLYSLGIESAELYLSRIIPNTPADRAGLKRNDKIISINGKTFGHWMDVLQTIRGFKADDSSLKIAVLRNGKLMDFEVTPEFTKQQGQQGQQEQRFTVGIAPSISLDVTPPVTLVKAETFGEALTAGWKQTIWWTKATFTVFVKIFENKISPRNIGGIISIQQAAKKTYDYGISVFIKMMGILSVNLFVMNLLPIPVLDGGHLFFYMIEFIKGTPLSVRKMEIATQVGLFLLLGLMVFAIFNDISMVFRLNW